MNTMNMHLGALKIEAQRSIAPRPEYTEPRRKPRVNAASAIERQIDEIQYTFSASWEW